MMGRRLVEGLHRTFPSLAFDADAVLFGAAVHDFGKVRHPNELTGPGSRHEQDGPPVWKGLVFRRA